MSYICGNGGHSHNTVYEGRVCYGLIKRAPAPRPYQAPVAPRDQPGSMSPAQEKYLDSLGATRAMLFTESGLRLSSNQASALIDRLKSRKGVAPVEPAKIDPRVAVVEGMFSMVPDAYFAVRPDANVPFTFVRVSTPTRGKWKGTRKVQTQHGPNLELAAARFPSGKWSIYRDSVLDAMLLIVTDPLGAAMTYAHEIEKCCRCNTQLTDDRSRWYGIGPDCEQVWPQVIDRVNEERGVYVPGMNVDRESRSVAR